MNIQLSTTTLSTLSSTTLSQVHLSATSGATDSKGSSNTDTLTISAQGLSMFKESQTANQEALSAATDESSKAKDSTLATVLGTTTDEGSDEATTTDLTSYTDSQLQSLVADGSITQAEATAELAKRKAESNEISAIENPLTHIDVQI